MRDKMLEYIRAIKRQFRDVYKFIPDKTEPGDDPCFTTVPDGEYPMMIEGKLDHVRIVKGMINCCNFEENKDV